MKTPVHRINHTWELLQAFLKFKGYNPYDTAPAYAFLRGRVIRQAG